jgi:hypothetical protein
MPLPIIPPRLHPESWRTLRQLVELHGIDAVLATVRTIGAESSAPLFTKETDQHGDAEQSEAPKSD